MLQLRRREGIYLSFSRTPIIYLIHLRNPKGNAQGRFSSMHRSWFNRSRTAVLVTPLSLVLTDLDLNRPQSYMRTPQAEATSSRGLCHIRRLLVLSVPRVLASTQPEVSIWPKLCPKPEYICPCHIQQGSTISLSIRSVWLLIPRVTMVSATNSASLKVVAASLGR